MRRILGFLIVAVVMLSYGCEQAEMTIQGSVSNYPSKEICLFEVEDGEYKLFGVQAVGEDSSFTFVLPQREAGFYFLGSSKDNIRPFETIYMKKGGHASIRINNRKIDEATYPYPEQQMLYNN